MQKAFDKSVIDGDIETIERLSKLNPDLSNALYFAMYNLKTTKWIYENLHLRFESKFLEYEQNGFPFEVLDYVRTVQPDLHNDDSIYEAVLECDLKYIKWFYNSYKDTEYMEEDLVSGLRAAAYCNNLVILHWIHDKYGEHCTEEVMDTAFENDSVDAIVWLYTNCNVCGKPLKDASYIGTDLE